MNLKERIDAFVRLGLAMKDIRYPSEFMAQAYNQNKWFTDDNIYFAYNIWGDTLSEKNVEEWLKPYKDKLETERGIRVGVINAGNIPFVGFHDFMSVLISGNNYVGKNASDDSILLPYVAEMLCDMEPRFKERIQFTDKLTTPDAVIATGSNNTARYFEYYFSKYPNIIRKNRNAVAVLTGKETKAELNALGSDIFQYFGLGCRNVSKLYVPRGYDFNIFFESIFDFSEVMQHNKYMNNFEYNNAVLLLKRIPFLQNGFLIIFEDKRIPSPIAVLHYEYYDALSGVEESLRKEKENIQCVVSLANLNIESPLVKFGETQHPAFWDYADGVNTMEFLLGLNN
jgi:hypothetical protein